MTTARAESAAHDLMHKMFAHVAGLHPWTPCPVCEEIFASALLAERRRAIEEAADVCGSLEALERGQYIRTHLSTHDIRCDAFEGAERAIRALASPREET
jgi:hypothetical protein